MMCSVVVIVVIVVAAAAQPFWKPAELHVGPNISLTSETAWLLSHINDPSLRRKDGGHWKKTEIQVKLQNIQISSLNCVVDLILNR